MGTRARARAYVRSLRAIYMASFVMSVAPSAVVTTCGKPGAKAKTRKSAAKRYKVTASGKVLHRRPGKQHLNGHKTTERKTRLSGERQVGRAQIPLVKGLLPSSRKKIR